MSAAPLPALPSGRDRTDPEGGPLVIVSTPRPCALELQRALRDSGVAAEVVAEPPDDMRHVVFLDAAFAAEPGGENVFRLFRQLREVGRRHRAQPGRVVVLTASGGDFGLRTDPGPRAVAAAVAGLAKTAAQEWTRMKVSIVDVAPEALSPATADRLAAEILATEPRIEVGLEPGGGRVAPQLVPVAPASAAQRFTTHGLWLVSGGGRGVTAPCLAALARRGPLSFLLLGRTEVPETEPDETAAARTEAELKRVLFEAARARGEVPAPARIGAQAAAILAAREIRATCVELRGLGANVRYARADVTDAAAVATALAPARREWGPVRGLVHAAGVLADKALHEKTDAQFQSVWRTKVDGFRALLAAADGDPLEGIAAFSSVAARFGNPGQADYAAANEALNKLCQVEQRRRGDGCRVRAINWGPWEGGMVTEALRGHFAARGVPLIPVDAGAETFADIMTGVLPAGVEAVVGGALPSAEGRG